MSENIPDHIYVEVLVRMPFKSLIRCKCVSKSWRDLINSSYFSGMQSRRSRLIQTNPHPDSKIVAMVGPKLYAYNYSENENGTGAFAKRLINSTPMEYYPGVTPALVGSCNGLILLRDRCRIDDLVLWNPFTGSYFELPSSPVEFTKVKESSPSTSVAFGYDHISDDYKVVKWYQIVGRYDLCVYSLKQNSWTTVRARIPFKLPPMNYYFSAECTIANGAAHWLWYERFRVNAESFIVAFDLATYDFRKVSFGSKIPHSYRHWIIGCFNGCLSLTDDSIVLDWGLHDGWIQEYKVVDIWVMKEYGDENSWEKIFSIEVDENGDVQTVESVVLFLEDWNKLLLEANCEGKLVVYDVKK